MREHNLRDDAFLFQWNFFERAISNYSIIIKMFQYMEGENELFRFMPRVFVEETVFDMCQFVIRREGTKGFFAIEDSLGGIAVEEIEKANGTIFSPTVLRNLSGYGTVYAYPLRRSVHVFGYLLLGKKKSVPLETATQRDLELLCEILNRFVLLKLYISEVKVAEHTKADQLDVRLATTQTLLENVIDQSPNVLLLVDKNGKICFTNRNARNEFAERRGFLVGENIQNIVTGLEDDFFEKDLVLQGELHYRQDSVYKLYKLESYPIKDAEGKIIFKNMVLKNVFDERIEEEESFHKNRMETIGRLAGGIAHDFNNVLTGILGYASLMKRMTEEEEQLHRYAEVIESSAKRAATLTEHLLHFSRRQRNRTRGSIDVNMLLDDVLFLIKESFRNIIIEKDFDEKLPPVEGDEGELQHVFLNLCINAKDAMGDNGTLRVKTERKTYIGDRDFAVVTIRDTGCGIGDEFKNRIFEPFFTTKAESKKLGMGLYLVQKVIRDHGGFIELESGEDKGTCFALYLPLKATEKEERKMATEPVKKAVPEKKRTILVVDDEEVVRVFVNGILTAEGFEVLQAKDGAEGIRLFEEHRQAIDLVILDMIMPGVKGDEVLRRIREISSSVKVIVSSGFMSDEQRDNLKEHGVNDFLDKPYVDADLIKKVDAVLSGGGPDETE
jgi:signal transduction histidine kinase/CheY-like chemotaxis protein